MGCLSVQDDSLSSTTMSSPDVTTASDATTMESSTETTKIYGDGAGASIKAALTIRNSLFFARLLLKGDLVLS